MKPDKPKLSEYQDPASLIAMALKKKFASRMLHSPCSPCSPDTDQENDYDSPDSPMASVSLPVHTTVMVHLVQAIMQISVILLGLA